MIERRRSIAPCEWLATCCSIFRALLLRVRPRKRTPPLRSSPRVSMSRPNLSLQPGPAAVYLASNARRPNASSGLVAASALFLATSSAQSLLVCASKNSNSMRCNIFVPTKLCARASLALLLLCTLPVIYDHRLHTLAWWPLLDRL